MGVEPNDVRKKGLIIALGVALILFGLISTPVYILFRPAMPKSQLDRLTSGMSKEEVQAVLGEPNVEIADHQWTYSRWANPGWVEIHFDEHGKLDYVNDESAFP